MNERTMRSDGTRRRPIGRFHAGVVAAFVAFVVLLAPASAQADDHSGQIDIWVGYLHDCQSGYFCAWPQDSDSNGGELPSGMGWNGWDKDWNASSIEHGKTPNMNNNSEFWANYGFVGSYDDVRMYQHSYYGGYSTCIPRARYFNNAPGSDSWENVPSSHYWVNSC